MNPKAGEHRCSELSGLDVGISARYHWSVARQLTSYSLRHWNLRNLTLQQECYLTNTRDFFRNTHGSIMLPPRQPRVFARLGSLAIIGFCRLKFYQNLQIVLSDTCQNKLPLMTLNGSISISNVLSKKVVKKYKLSLENRSWMSLLSVEVICNLSVA